MGYLDTKWGASALGELKKFSKSFFLMRKTKQKRIKSQVIKMRIKQGKKKSIMGNFSQIIIVVKEQVPLYLERMMKNLEEIQYLEIFSSLSDLVV